jgi:hypothetical protein
MILILLSKTLASQSSEKYRSPTSSICGPPYITAVWNSIFSKFHHYTNFEGPLRVLWWNLSGLQCDLSSLDNTLLRTLENALQFGKPLLQENVPDELDPILDPVLQKHIYKLSCADVIKIGDTIIPYNSMFQSIQQEFPETEKSERATD